MLRFRGTTRTRLPSGQELEDNLFDSWNLNGDGGVLDSYERKR